MRCQLKWGFLITFYLFTAYPFVCLLTFNIFNFLLRTTSPISTKLDTKHPNDSVCRKEKSYPLKERGKCWHDSWKNVDISQNVLSHTKKIETSKFRFVQLMISGGLRKGIRFHYGISSTKDNILKNCNGSKCDVTIQASWYCTFRIVQIIKSNMQRTISFARIKS